MKAEISAAGVLTITPDTPVESYALRKWADEAIIQSACLSGRDDAIVVHSPKFMMIHDCSKTGPIALIAKGSDNAV